MLRLTSYKLALAHPDAVNVLEDEVGAMPSFERTADDIAVTLVPVSISPRTSKGEVIVGDADTAIVVALTPIITGTMSPSATTG